jgi:hypothetical protein
MNVRIIFFIAFIFIYNQAFALEKTISWNKIEKATEYLVKVCLDKKCKAKLLQEKIKEPTFKKDYKPGKYFFFMAAVSRTGKKGFWSKAAPFTILPDKPILSSPDSEEKIDVVSNNSVTYEWERLEGAKSYLLEVVDSKGKVYTYTTTKLSQPHKVFMVGETKWRVKAGLKTGEFGEFSDYRVLIMYKEPPRLTTFSDHETMELHASAHDLYWTGELFTKYRFKLSYAKTDLAKYNQEVEKVQKHTHHEIKYAKLGMYKVDLEGLYKGFWVPAKPTHFEFKDPGPPAHIFKLALMAGAPRTNLTQTGMPEYATSNDETGDNLIYSSIQYEYNWGFKVVGLDLKKTLLSNTMTNDITKIYYGYKFGTKSFQGYFKMGYYNYNLNIQDDADPGNFLIKNHSIYYLGTGIYFRGKIPVDSRISFFYDMIAPIRPDPIHETKTGTEWELSYEYFPTKTFGVLLGVFKSTLNHKISVPSTQVEDIPYRQSLLTVKIGFSINF